MTALLWACGLFILFGMSDAQAQTCTQEYKLTVNQCMYTFSYAVNSAASGFRTEITSSLLLMKMVCERSEYRHALLCAFNGLKVCGNVFGYPEEMLSILRKVDEPLINKICGYIPALEQNLPCVNGVANSSTLRECIRPTVQETCRFNLAHELCALTEVQTMCPAIGELFLEVLRLDYDQTCPMDSCMFEFGVCGGTFRRNMPVKAVQRYAGDYPAISHGIQYICGSGKKHVECMMRGGQCEGFNSLMAVPQMFGIQLEPAGYLVTTGCKGINTLTQNLPCLNQHFASQAFQACLNEMLRKVNPNSRHQTQFKIVSCDIYQGTSNCMESIIAKQCGQEVVDYYIKWSPAVFPLAEGCGSWKVSSASSVEKITTLMLLQLSVVLLFF